MTTSDVKFSSHLYDVPRLSNDGGNFQTWKFHVITILDLCSLLKVTTGNEPEPAKPEKDDDPKPYHNWLQRDKDACAQIILTLEDEPLNGILYVKFAKDIWDKLHACYEDKCKQTVAYLI